jgi:hypothetical protein
MKAKDLMELISNMPNDTEIVFGCIDREVSMNMGTGVAYRVLFDLVGKTQFTTSITVGNKITEIQFLSLLKYNDQNTRVGSVIILPNI